MKTLLWLDDIRNPFIADWLMMYSPDFAYGEGKVEWVKNYSEFTKWIETNGLPDKIAFDHDLGRVEDMTGYDCAKWLVDYCLDNDLDIPNWTVQSANPVGASNINNLLVNYVKQRQQ